ncbi:UDP-N-acetylmuramoylalanine--D-glutamate ligase [Tissierella praeacuta DSM 18095]|uniref:UDP-N-acetylmuramoylalanine--D-glutamate ligase n=1 Tax=Tissierella praeacuta DSM 18095 TaxID=1123404 RepID=A0A1M4SUJ9_9FIRM|nr:UDP-N-acetylmuramoyl-L-alanine--D-glutamate ligase [Tissierella praeacuta]TCU70703.1 UDP-N-acetylmuramoylalanine--D-glutamate ligase [Tissierella praeacuta]SHE35900.1 UDP-N-acetylmuramoylalanine--D-glutamate ligase [Tissierella praeacuta DSM 18095]SUP01780.1 UDP-N-acetylmuramoylalanine--D-glutamate ligase [Tissierella praeacuta]
MYLKNKKVLVFGLGISGLSTVKALHKLGAQIIVCDSKTKDELKDFFDKIKDIYVEKHLNTNELPLEDIDLIVKSPGIPPTAPILVNAQEKNIEVITDIELAYRISPTDNIIAITGTNGKTTTTTLVGEIFKKANCNTYVAGNIGVGILWDMVNANKDDVFVIEASSFQLENTIYFKPKVSLVTNIAPDHLNWHGSLDNYILSKKKIFKNQDKYDYTVLNYEDKTLREIQNEVNSNIIWFSANQKLDNGVFIDGDYIVLKDGQNLSKILPYRQLKILGKHNLENALGAIAISWAMGIELEIIAEVLREFPGVEHRIEYVKTIKGISFYNDSKGTNSDSTIKAIEALEAPIILIAGGYDKGAEFDELILSFNGKVKELILLGSTKEKIKETAINNGFNNVHLVENMKEAVKLAYNCGEEKDNILLSPACASWDMYNNFEERGQDFKDAVYGLKGD